MKKRTAEKIKQQEGRIKISDFRDAAIKIPAHINAEVSEDKSGFLFDSNTGKVYALNRTASFVFSKIKEGLTISAIVKRLINRYDIDEGIAVSDIQDFLYQLKEFSLESEE